MIIPKTKPAWKKLRPSTVKEAIRLNKEYARKFKRLTVPAIAELMGVSEDLLYKWCSIGSIPAHKIPMFEHLCGIDFLTQYYAARTGKLLIDIPTGNGISEIELAELQQLNAETMTLLIRSYKNGEDIEKTTASLTQLIAGFAYHRENISTQPELEFSEDEE